MLSKNKKSNGRSEEQVESHRNSRTCANPEDLEIHRQAQQEEGCQGTKKALEEADNSTITEAKRATGRDFTVPGQTQAHEQRKKELIERSQKAEEIRKAAQPE